MKNFSEKDEICKNIFNRLVAWLYDHFETIVYFIFALLVVGLTILFTYSIESTQRSARQGQLWDLPINRPGTYVRTDPDTNIEYIIVISESGSISICPRKGANNVR